ncbi:uncharacterized protein [Temnothorax nylanderi]|uniref:uncharacterized protein isoform X2 n=1 Tax=Temnothorax nylanderi TaxID=102681 RepID=UPI003A8BE230
MPTQPTRRSIIGRSSLAIRYLLVGCIVSLSTSLAQVEGRKCVCTSKACKEAGVDTCRTRSFCYTELIMTTGREIGESTTTRGCTEGATPLLCETKSWVTRSRSVNAVELSSASPRILVPWPRLKCCNSHDYCNADADDDDDDDDDDDENASTWTRERKYEDSTESADRLLRNRIKALHIAALVLAIAALISVLASCYVVTRFLRNNRYIMGTVNYS